MIMRKAQESAMNNWDQYLQAERERDRHAAPNPYWEERMTGDSEIHVADNEIGDAKKEKRRRRRNKRRNPWVAAILNLIPLPTPFGYCYNQQVTAAKVAGMPIFFLTIIGLLIFSAVAIFNDWGVCHTSHFEPGWFGYYDSCDDYDMPWVKILGHALILPLPIIGISVVHVWFAVKDWNAKFDMT
jgi:hypothetical protein